MSALEEQLRQALAAGTAGVDESADLFARVQLSIDEDRRLQARRRRTAGVVACLVGALVAAVAAVTDFNEGELRMDWWILELISTAVLVGVALWLGPLIKRYGKSYAADVFRANPRTGKSFIVLTDFAYYLIFFAYILFTLSFEPKGSWADTVNAGQLQHETARLGGILLILGVLHGVNLLALPIMGRLLTLNRRLDEGAPPPAPTPADQAVPRP
jgi:type III secretory pathway component EscS